MGVSRSTVSMNTQYSDPYAFQKKKNAKSGRGELLKGYTVGSLAPGVAVKSGTTISEMGTSYGISNRFGGKINGQKVTATDEEPKDNNAAMSSRSSASPPSSSPTAPRRPLERRCR